MTDRPRFLNAGNAGPFTLDGTRTYLVGRSAVAVIDPGPASDSHLRALTQAVEAATSVTVVVTHGHPDHAPGARSLAASLGIHLLAGSFLEKTPEARAYNTSLLFSPEGEILAQYRKIHLFDIDIPGQVSIKESDTKKPGQEVVTCETGVGTVGLSVCYDLRFPELYRQLADNGAELICVPAAFTFPTGAAHWEPLLRARAIENQSYLIAPNQIGKNVHGFADYGNSMIIDPWGKVIARAPDKECVITAEIDREYVEKIRKELPCLAHRRL